jgi:hypothetical protein
MNVDSFRDLKVWREGVLLTTSIYRLTNEFPHQVYMDLPASSAAVRFPFPRMSPKFMREFPLVNTCGTFLLPLARSPSWKHSYVLRNICTTATPTQSQRSQLKQTV